jgi:DNA/RNA-binding domain of Phe-tRNA-synthetase-like protein
MGKIALRSDIPECVFGFVVARNCRYENAGGIGREVERVVLLAKKGQDDPERTRIKGLVRDMLRFGKYKPTGRGKPASEYLEREALEGRFPVINPLVDINNVVSLEFLLPLSVFDLEKANADEFLIRRGREGEGFVFNQAGQVISLQDLIVVCRMPDDEPIGSPVKDSHKTKTWAQTKEALYVVYAPDVLERLALEASMKLADLLCQFVTEDVEVCVVWGANV